VIAGHFVKLDKKSFGVMNNIQFPTKFQEKLQDIMEGVYQLFELSKEHDLAPVSEDGVSRYMEEDGKTCFQVSGQFDRPSEFLQSLLDIIRVNYEPCVLGTFFLNSNMAFMYENIPESPFRLGYVSLTSETNKEFSVFWNDDVIPYIDKCGYTVSAASVIYAVASTGKENYGIGFVDSILETLNSGFSVDEAVNLLAASIYDTTEAPRKQIYSGYCLDSALGNRIRLSLWLFIRPKEYTVQ
jgi:hypothetical protein